MKLNECNLGARASARFNVHYFAAQEMSHPPPVRGLKRRERRAPIAISGFMFAVMIAVLALSGCGKAAPGKPTSPPAAVTVEAVTDRLLSRLLTVTGTIEPTTVAGLASQAEGPVLGCRVREGDRVTEGQELLRIGRQLSAEAAQSSAKEELRRQRHLGKKEMDVAMDRLRRTVLRMDDEIAKSGGPWLLGRDISLADVSVMPVIVRLADLRQE